MYGTYDLVTIRRYDDPLQAHLARCLLENEEIEAFVADENVVTLNRLWSYAVGRVKLKVKEMDRTEAMRILAEADHLPYHDEHEQVLSCPQCGSTDLTNGVLKPRTLGGWMNFIVAALFMAHPIAMDSGMLCNRCNLIFDPPTSE